MGEFKELPPFIYAEMIGPYGSDALQKINEVIRRYKIYSDGADFEVEDRGDYVHAKHKSKIIKSLIDKEAQFAFGKTPEMKVFCPEEEKGQNGKENESAMQSYLNSVLKANRIGDKLIKGAKDCFIGAKVALKVNVLPDRISIMFVPADGFLYQTALDDVDTLERITFFYTVTDSDDRNKQRIWVQKYWMENGKCFISERVTDGFGKAMDEYSPVEHEDTGLDRIPAYVIINDGLSGDTDGESDVDIIKAEDSWYSRMRSANIDSLRKGMYQITYGINVSGDSAKNFRIAPGAYWDVQADQSGENDGQPVIGTISDGFTYTAAYRDTLSNLRQSMYDALGIPDINLDTMRSIVTSGKAMKAIYWPLICRCEEKMTAWRPALEWLIELLIDVAEIYPGLKKRYGTFGTAPYVAHVENQYPLPEDEDEERQLDMQEVNTRARSVKSYLSKWGGPDRSGLQGEDADAEIQQIAQELRMMEDSYTEGGEL